MNSNPMTKAPAAINLATSIPAESRTCTLGAELIAGGWSLTPGGFLKMTNNRVLPSPVRAVGRLQAEGTPEARP